MALEGHSDLIIPDPCWDCKVALRNIRALTFRSGIIEPKLQTRGGMGYVCDLVFPEGEHSGGGSLLD